MTIDFICNSFLDFLRQNNYRKTTLVYYKRITNQFRRFCKERKTDMYTTEIGRQFSEDVLGIKTGEFNISKFHYWEGFLESWIHFIKPDTLIFLLKSGEHLNLKLSILRNILYKDIQTSLLRLIVYTTFIIYLSI